MAKFIVVIGFICALWVIYNVWFVNKYKSGEAKLLWTLAAIFFSIITAIVYYFSERRNQ